MPDRDGRPADRLIVSSPALRALEKRVPAKVAFAIHELITGPSLVEPHRIGKPLDDPFRGLLSARKGTYRVIYRVHEDDREVEVVGIDHRADIYRPQRERPRGVPGRTSPSQTARAHALMQ